MPNIAELDDDDYATTVLSEDDAWTSFLGFLANTLRLEMDNTLPWSILDYSDAALNWLLSSRYFFEWTDLYGGYSIGRLRRGTDAVGWPSRSRSVHAPPPPIHSFLSSNAIVASTRLDTIGNLLEWCRENLLHFSNGMSASNAEYHWQYRGFPPASRIIEGTLLGGQAGLVRNWTAGCHGTNAFLNNVLRVVNIPVPYVRVPQVGHATPYFITEGYYLSHGDDPYNTFTKGDPPPYSALELLISPAKYDAWFGYELSIDERGNNVGRRVYELALAVLPKRLLEYHCDDVSAGRSRAESQVFRTFDRWFTVEELEAMDLWTRLQEKVDSLGGCDAI